MHTFIGPCRKKSREDGVDIITIVDDFYCVAVSFGYID